MLSLFSPSGTDGFPAPKFIICWVDFPFTAMLENITGTYWTILRYFLKSRSHLYRCFEPEGSSLKMLAVDEHKQNSKNFSKNETTGEGSYGSLCLDLMRGIWLVESDHVTKKESCDWRTRVRPHSGWHHHIPTWWRHHHGNGPIWMNSKWLPSCGRLVPTWG